MAPESGWNEVLRIKDQIEDLEKLTKSLVENQNEIKAEFESFHRKILEKELEIFEECRNWSQNRENGIGKDR